MLVHPLVDFIYAEFGKPLGDLLLVGYGSKTAGQKASFEFTEQTAMGTASWIVEVSARPLPQGKEPLVLAALLKFLLLRIDLDNERNVFHNFEFNMQALLEEVGRDGTRMTAAEAEEIIERYVLTSYHLRDAEPRPGLVRPRERTSGHYLLVVGYTTLLYRDEGDEQPRRLLDRVNLASDLVEGLKRGEITFAGMKLGERQPDNSFAGFPFVQIL
jgi:hypothetical protein